MGHHRGPEQADDDEGDDKRRRGRDVLAVGDLPLLGFFFRGTSTTSNKTELLVFITPRIVNERLTIR